MHFCLQAIFRDMGLQKKVRRSPQSDWKMKLSSWCIISFWLCFPCEHPATFRWILSQLAFIYFTSFLSFMPCWHKIFHAYIQFEVIPSFISLVCFISKFPLLRCRTKNKRKHKKEKTAFLCTEKKFFSEQNKTNDHIHYARSSRDRIPNPSWWTTKGN